MSAERQSRQLEHSHRAGILPDGGDGPEGRGAGWYARFKPVADFGLALLLLVSTAPLVLLAAALVKLTSRGPAFSSRLRLGRHGRPFRIYTLRTSAPPGASPEGPCKFACRLTRVGRFLRRTHLDDLPQLWNVLRGDMSLVGPRPERPEFLALLQDDLPCYQQRLCVRPGLTGLAQVQLPPDTDLASIRLRLAYDLAYVRRLSLGLDLRILLAAAWPALCLPFVQPGHLSRGESGE